MLSTAATGFELRSLRRAASLINESPDCFISFGECERSHQFSSLGTQGGPRKLEKLEKPLSQCQIDVGMIQFYP